MTKPDHDAYAEAPLLVPAAAAGEGAPSFADVFREHAAYVLGLLGRLGVSDADVEDVAQEVFVTVHAKLPGFEGRSSVKTWVCGICLRKASDYRRRAHRRRERLLAAPDERVADPDTPHELAVRREDVRLLRQVLDALPERLMQVFVLYELEELPMAEVARAVGCPRFTGYTRLRAARRAVREELMRLRGSGGAS